MKKMLLAAMLIFTSGQAVCARKSGNPPMKTDQLLFLENKGQITDQSGQARPDVDFRLTSGNMNVFVGSGTIHYQWSAAASAAQDINIYRMDVRLLGANPDRMPLRENREAYMEKYYLPQCGTEGCLAESFSKVVYKEVYPNIDWVLYIRNGKLEHDFIIHPGGNAADIRMEFKGATSLSVNPDGSFTAVTPFGSVNEAAPFSFQEDGKKVASSFVLSDNILGFHTGNSQGRFTIDPAVSWATYIGGNGIWEEVEDITCNKSNDVYVVGEATSAANIATTGSHQVTYGGANDALLMKFNKQGILLWATYYGGSLAEKANAVACDSLGYVYISGKTRSTSGIATAGGHQPAHGGGSFDGFFAKFDSTGTRIFGSYYGGPDEEDGIVKITVEGGYFFLSGSTASTSGIATAGTHQSAFGGTDDCFLAKFSLGGVRQWGTYFGGTGAEGLGMVASDHHNNVYLFGTTNSESGIATPSAHKSIHSISTDGLDHFLAKFNANGVRQWATYYGGPGEEAKHNSSRNVDCDASGNVYITGPTNSTSGIASTGSHQSLPGGAWDIYLAKFDSTGARQWATYYGGTEDEIFPSLHIADTHIVYLNSTSKSTTNIATANAIQPAFAGGNIYGDAFLARFNGSGQRIYSTYYGGTGMEGGRATTTDKEGNVYLGGVTNSLTGVATPGSYKSTYPGAIVFNGLLVKFCFEAPASRMQIEGPDSICRYDQKTYAIQAVEDATAYIWTLPSGWSGSSDSSSISVTPDLLSGIITVRVVRCGDTSDIVPFNVYVVPAAPAVITVNNFLLGTVGTYTSYQWLLNGQQLPGGNTATITATANGDYRVITVNHHGCTDTSAVYTVSNVTALGNNSTLAGEVSLFPNPSSGIIHIHTPVALNIIVSTIEGRVLERQLDKKAIDISSYPPGIYMLRLSDAKGVWIKTEKIIKMK